VIVMSSSQESLGEFRRGFFVRAEVHSEVGVRETGTALERMVARRFLWDVHGRPASIPTIIATIGALAASATTGALIAMGHRVGGASLPFTAIASVLLGRELGAGSSPLVVAGVLLHLIATVIWTAVFVWLLRTWSGRDVLAALVVGAAELTYSWSVAHVTGAGIATMLPLGDRVVLAVILSASLVAGIRFAFSRGESRSASV
jgi:hypothetical protein